MLTLFLILGVLASLAGGGWILKPKAFTAASFGGAFAFRSGILTGVAFIHLLPGAWRAHPAYAGWGAVAAFVLFFAAENYAMTDPCHEDECRVHSLGAAAMAGLLTHSLIDGANLAVAFSAGRGAGTAAGTALVIHKLADGFTLSTLFRQAGYRRLTGLGALGALAMATPLGALLADSGLSSLPPAALGGALGFSAGSFVYLAAADIVPRLHRSRSLTLAASFAAGVAAMAVLHRLAE
jgi:zinc and cadmium transporter